MMEQILLRREIQVHDREELNETQMKCQHQTFERFTSTTKFLQHKKMLTKTPVKAFNSPVKVKFG